MKEENSIITQLNDLHFKGVIAALPIVLVVMFIFIRNDYKDKHDECRIYQHNINALFTRDQVLNVNKNERSVIVRYLTTDSKTYKMLSDSFINNVQIGDTLFKTRRQNNVIINRNSQKIEVPFSQVPEKDCD